MEEEGGVSAYRDCRTMCRYVLGTVFNRSRAELLVQKPAATSRRRPAVLKLPYGTSTGLADLVSLGSSPFDF